MKLFVLGVVEPPGNSSQLTSAIRRLSGSVWGLDEGILNKDATKS